MRIHQKDSVIAGMLGNSFTKTVMQRVLKAAIAAAEAPACENRHPPTNEPWEKNT